MTTVRGISDRVDVVWSRDGVELEKREVVSGSVSSTLDNFAVYVDFYVITELSTTDDDGKMYTCEVIINTRPPIMAAGTITLNVTKPSEFIII